MSRTPGREPGDAEAANAVKESAAVRRRSLPKSAPANLMERRRSRSLDLLSSSVTPQESSPEDPKSIGGKKVSFSKTITRLAVEC